MAKFNLHPESDPTPDEVRFLEDRLYEFNVGATGIADGETLAFFVRGEKGKILAAACGHTWGGCCEIRQLWVDAPLRKQGLGSALMRAAEDEARRRGCQQIVLSTHSFQAPDFYRRLGFEVVAAIEDYPQGHRQIVLRKVLEP
jgi:ribosomal protein S18 acetylase RimI-like enzyme